MYLGGLARERSRSSSRASSRIRGTLTVPDAGPSATAPPPESSSVLRATSDLQDAQAVRLGRMVVSAILTPVIDSAIQGAQAGREDKVEGVDALESIRTGFARLADSNAELAWQVFEGLLNGINECVRTLGFVA